MESVSGEMAARSAETRPVHVERKVNDHGAMTVRITETRELRIVMGYASLGLRE